MSGTRRTPIGRSRHPSFTAEAIRLFAALENTPRNRRSSQAFKENERELARLLSLTSEWWSGNNVLDDADAPCWPDHLQAHKDWYRLRAIRKQLLAAISERAA
jgi:hypothetical protein